MEYDLHLIDPYIIYGIFLQFARPMKNHSHHQETDTGITIIIQSLNDVNGFSRV